MDIKDKLTLQEKQAFENLRVEMLVLQNLLNEKRGQAELLLKATFQRLNYSPLLNGLEFNAALDKWEVKLRPDAIALPSIQQRGRPRNFKQN